MFGILRRDKRFVKLDEGTFGLRIATPPTELCGATSNLLSLLRRKTLCASLAALQATFATQLYGRWVPRVWRGFWLALGGDVHKVLASSLMSVGLLGLLERSGMSTVSHTLPETHRGDMGIFHVPSVSGSRPS